MWRVLRVTSGVALVLAGVAMLVLPGPGLLTVIAGLVALRSEVPAAKKLLSRLEQRFPWLAREAR